MIPHLRALLVVLERRAKPWKRGGTTGHGHRPRERRIAACHQAHLLQEVAQATRRFGLPDTAPVVRCSAAGRAGVLLEFLRAGNRLGVVVTGMHRRIQRCRQAEQPGRTGRKLRQDRRHISREAPAAHGVPHDQRRVHAPVRQVHHLLPSKETWLPCPRWPMRPGGPYVQRVLPPESLLLPLRPHGPR
jgi:hypothetical protein